MIGCDKSDNFANVCILENYASFNSMNGQFRSIMIGDISRRLDDLASIELLIFYDIFYSWLDGGGAQYIGKILDDFLQKYYEDKSNQ